MFDFNLTDEFGRIAAINHINVSCKQAFLRVGFEAIPGCRFEVDSQHIHIGLPPKDPSENGFLPGSEITINYKPGRSGSSRAFNLSMSCGGSFNPDDKSQYCRIIHAASVLKHWDNVCNLTKSYCDRYSMLEKEIFRQNEINQS